MAIMSLAWSSEESRYNYIGSKVACASVLKPLYAWIGTNNRNIAYEAIAKSNNIATSIIINNSGGLTSMLEKIYERTGVKWESNSTWGQVDVTAPELLIAYNAMRENKDRWTRDIIYMMQKSLPSQRLGIDSSWVNKEKLAIKIGWDLDISKDSLNTLAVAFDTKSIIAICSKEAISKITSKYWQELLDKKGPQAVLVLHKEGYNDVEQSIRNMYNIK
jgi:hypothetical protein